MRMWNRKDLFSVVPRCAFSPNFSFLEVVKKHWVCLRLSSGHANAVAYYISLCMCVRKTEWEKGRERESECCIACKSEWSPAAAPAEVTQDKSPPLRSAVISWINTHLSPSPCSRLMIHFLLHRNQQTSQVYSSADSFTDTDHTMYTNEVIFGCDCSNNVKWKDIWGFCRRNYVLGASCTFLLSD